MMREPRKKTRCPVRRIVSVAGVTCVLVCGVIAGPPLWPAYAQQNAERSVQGRVVDDADKPLSKAIVYLSDLRTLTVESYITQDDGAYRFQQLSPNDDYKLWAQLDDRKSKSKTLSSYDNRSIFRVILKIGPGK
ncbi:MAG: carboxypeptidase-like regulatory domain-containing protein [Acidobacteriaceae bacterium]